MTYPSKNAVLKVRKDTMNPDYWCLLWDDGGVSFTWAEGECSKTYYRTMRDAIAGGESRFGERAVKADW